jgi:hypothetical protein
VCVCSRRRVNLIEETAAIAPVEDASEAPRVVLERLDVHDLDEQDVARHRGLDLEWAAQVVDLGEVDIADVIGRVVVLDLAAGPVDTLNLDCLSVLDRAGGRD